MSISFEDMLLDYAKATTEEARQAIEAQAWERFGQRKAILAMDMSGFSCLTQRHGIVHYLSMVRRMQLVSQPIVDQHHGEVIKFEADNCLAAFDTPLDAVRASLALNIAFDSMNIFTPREQDIAVSIGIDEGRVLRLNGPHGLDYMGNAVNRAFKLGEDIASAGEILVTRSTFDLIPAEAGFKGRNVTLSVSGIEIAVVSLERSR